MISADRCPRTRKEKLLAGLVQKDSLGLEIGALCRPLLLKDDGPVIYVDHADTETLRTKYKDDPSVDVNAIVEVDAVWGSNTLQQALGTRRVDYVVASHVVEHVPDLVAWLTELRSILKPNGEVRLVVPDKRFTFDYFREETRIASVLYCNLIRARIPQPQLLIDYCVNVAKVDCFAAWRGPLDPHLIERHHDIDTALGVARDCLENGAYHDVHCWVFSPHSFAQLFREMAELELIDFACANFFDTDRNDMEFFVSLQPSDDKSHIVESWRLMETETVDDAPDRPFWKTRRALRSAITEAT
ncbi:methyltransferase domain-containing protein [Paraburkholderia caffeinilytica]|uniref:methyltransferase domain-containing protein n=1 Tax=Paraburkholderia caffeinilytica TaxID=1761016 RepID=UPI003DA0EB06